jgi:hypothetical protein
MCSLYGYYITGLKIAVNRDCASRGPLKPNKVGDSYANGVGCDCDASAYPDNYREKGTK